MDMGDSVKMVSGCILNLFVKKDLIRISKLAIETQTQIESIKKAIIFKALNVCPEEVIRIYQSLTREQIEQIGMDFCLKSLQNLSLSHSIKNYSILFGKTVEVFGLNQELIETFYQKKRLSQEIGCLFEYITNWEYLTFTGKLYVQQSLHNILQKKSSYQD